TACRPPQGRADAWPETLRQRLVTAAQPRQLCLPTPAFFPPHPGQRGRGPALRRRAL
ncbi:hypothetical protein HK405_010066, partial [Cladochytrium tenue]